MQRILDVLNKKQASEALEIKKGAFEKMKAYASLVSDIVGEDVECYGLLLGDERGVTDICLEKNQEVSARDCRFHEKSTIEEYVKRKEKNQKIIGVWHSHGVNPLHHSNDDDSHLESILRKNYKFFPEKEEEKVDTTMVGDEIIFESNGEEFRIKSNKAPEIKKTSLTASAYSIVINRDTYSSRNSKECYVEKLYKKGSIKRNKDLELRIVDGGKINKKKLLKEIGEFVVYNGELLKNHPNYNYVFNEIKEEEKLRKNYSFCIREFYTSNNNIAGEIAKILSGDYKVNGKRVWLWQDRVELAKKILKKNNVCGPIKEILDILKLNKYANRKHSHKLKLLYNNLEGIGK